MKRNAVASILLVFVFGVAILAKLLHPSPAGRHRLSEVRWFARVFGTFIALIALFGILGAVGELAAVKADCTITTYLINVGFLLVFVGCVVGWFKDLAASLFILGGPAHASGRARLSGEPAPGVFHRHPRDSRPSFSLCPPSQQEEVRPSGTFWPDGFFRFKRTCP